MMNNSFSSATVGRFSPEVENNLKQAGWYAGRCVSDDEIAKWLIIECPVGRTQLQIRMFSAAYRVLKEFGGLTIGASGRGLTCFRQPFIFNPLVVTHYPNWAEEWFFVEWFSGSLFPIGSHGDYDSLLCITTDGHVIDIQNYVFYGSFEKAVEMLLIGQAPLPWKYDKAKELEGSTLRTTIYEMIR